MNFFVFLQAMDIELLSKMIVELVRVHDTVTLPGLGSFVSSGMPASFSDKGFTINPPYRKLSFVPGESGDRYLAELYSGSNGIDIAAGESILKAFLLETKEALKQQKSIALPGLGRLRATRDNKFFFVEDADAKIGFEEFGLEPVSLKNHTPAVELPPVEPEPVQVEQEEPLLVPEPLEEAAVETAPETAEPSPEPKKRGGSNWWIAPVVVVLVAAVALAAFIILAHVAPDYVDSILYTPEELRIINS